MMDLMQEAILLGFSGAAVMDTKELVFVPEYRTFCEENLCGCYNSSLSTRKWNRGRDETACIKL